ncbi:MAG: cupin domain-containing protein [Candidatus Delongbacteria bacterium]|nr:cupin domain-containing protein [Candidatus Delongbacteria bacterium]
MLERKYDYSQNTEKTIERIIDDENIHLNHMILPKGACLPEHSTNSNVYFIIVKGTMSMKLGEQEEQNYTSCLLNVPFNIKMNVCNKNDDLLEFFVVKSPNTKNNN